MGISILLYVAAMVFIAGNLYRVIRFVTLPASVRWELYPIPRGPEARQRYGGSYFEESHWWTRPLKKNLASEAGFIAQEVLFQKAVWKNNRLLWPWSWLLHWGLYGYVATITLAISFAIAAWVGVPHAATIGSLAAALPWFCMPAGFIGATGLFVLRLSSRKLREYSSRATLLNLGVLAAIFGTGSGILFFDGGTRRMLELAATLIRMNAAPPVPGIALAHAVLIACFLAYFPLTQMTHAYMKFFAFHRVRWEDTPTHLDSHTQSQMATNLARPVSWAAAHIRGGGGATWSTTVAEGAERDAKRP